MTEPISFCAGAVVTGYSIYLEAITSRPPIGWPVLPCRTVMLIKLFGRVRKSKERGLDFVLALCYHFAYCLIRNFFCHRITIIWEARKSLHTNIFLFSEPAAAVAGNNYKRAGP